MNDYLLLAAELGANPAPLPARLEVKAAEVQAAIAGLGSLGAGSEALKHARSPVLLGLNPSSAYGPAKRWPAARFGEVARDVAARAPDCVWLAFGSGADRELCDEVSQAAGGHVVNLAGKTSLSQLMALLQHCRVLLTNDSGPMHLAAALGTPVVVPFGSTSPELTGPGQPGDARHHVLRGDAPCAPCFRRTCPVDLRCLTTISVEKAVRSILQVLGANSGLDARGALP